MRTIFILLFIGMRLAAQDTIVLLHGWWSSPLLLKRLEWALKRDGYQVVNLSYPSVSMPLERIGTEYLPGKLRERVPSDSGKIHFVTHSMGGLVLRRFLMTPHRPANLGRVVMLGPPNHGSEVADLWSRFGLCRLLAGPNLAALGTGGSCAAATLPPADFELHVIAGDRTLWPFWSPLAGPHDGKVSVASTRLVGMTSHYTIRRSHTVLPLSRPTIDSVREFLRNGKPSASAPASDDFNLPCSQSTAIAEKLRSSDRT